LREMPLLDLWLRGRPDLRPLIDEPDVKLRKAPCLPHRFVAVVPYRVEGREAASDLARYCREQALKAWQEIAGAVKQELDGRWKGEVGWDKLWDKQIENYFDFHTAVLPCNEVDDETLAGLLAGRDSFAEAFPQAAAVRSLAEAIPEAARPGYSQRSAGQWQHRLELSARLMEAQRSVRRVPEATPEGDVPPKCSVLGSYEQIGPAGLGESARFWEEAVKGFRKQTFDGVRMTARERFCAVSLVKRFSGPAFFQKALGLGRHERRFADTATVAAATWLAQARGRGFDWLDPDRVRDEHDHWSGQWLYWSTRNQDKDEVPCPQEVFDQIEQARAPMALKRPPAYYAILVMDGDDMGKWLSGQKLPPVRKIMHPKLRQEYFDLLPRQDLVQEALKARRPVGPALHAAISEALANFALYVVPDVIQDHDGTLIYAGGDDVVALLPTEKALACARKLRRAFSGEQDVNGGADRGYYRVGVRDRLMMGPSASLSAGLAVVHYKEDLRFAVGQARQAEKRAKDGGKNALAITVCRRSGEHGTALCGWDFAETVNRWASNFKGEDSAASKEGASDRWVYHLKAELPTLRGLNDLEPMAAEIRRQIGRAEPLTRDAFPAGELEAAFRRFVDFVLDAKRRPEDDAFLRAYPTAEKQERELRGRALEGFVALCQTASFLARGRDE
jgi:CRISPR-associated protein Cmr2